MIRGLRPTSFARCAWRRRFGSSCSSHTSTRWAAVMNVATKRHAGRRTGERIGADAVPADVLLAVLGPELLGLLGNRLDHSGCAGVDLLPPHLRKGSDTVSVASLAARPKQVALLLCETVRGMELDGAYVWITTESSSPGRARSSAAPGGRASSPRECCGRMSSSRPTGTRWSESPSGTPSSRATATGCRRWSRSGGGRWLRTCVEEVSGFYVGRELKIPRD